MFTFVLSCENQKIKEATRVLKICTKSVNCVRQLALMMSLNENQQFRLQAGVLLERNMARHNKILNKNLTLLKQLIERLSLVIVKPYTEKELTQDEEDTLQDVSLILFTNFSDKLTQKEDIIQFIFGNYHKIIRFRIQKLNEIRLLNISNHNKRIIRLNKKIIKNPI